VKVFIRKVAVFSLLQLGLALALWPFRVQFQTNTYEEASLDKQHRLATAESPRIVFIGGSNLAYGMDSPLVKEELRLEPVNMGLNAQLGLEFILSETASSLREGDLVVMSLEYDFFLINTSVGVEQAKMLMMRPANIRHLSWTGAARLSDVALGFICQYERASTERMIRLERGSPLPNNYRPYSRDSLNEYGDIVAHQLPELEKVNQERHRDFLKRAEGWLADGPPRLSRRQQPATIRRLNKFHRQCQARNIRVVFFYPPYPDLLYEANSDYFTELSQRLDKELTIPILSKPEESVYPHTAFYDSINHLKPAAKDHLTRLRIERLKQCLK
jgi:hypothetical protein